MIEKVNERIVRNQLAGRWREVADIRYPVAGKSAVV